MQSNFGAKAEQINRQTDRTGNLKNYQKVIFISISDLMLYKNEIGAGNLFIAMNDIA